MATFGCFGADDSDEAARSSGSVYALSNGAALGTESAPARRATCDLCELFEPETPPRRPPTLPHDHFEAPFIQWSEGVAAEIRVKRARNLALRQAYLKAEYHDSSEGHSAATRAARDNAFGAYAFSCRRAWLAVGLEYDVLDEAALGGSHPSQAAEKVAAIQVAAAKVQRKSQNSVTIAREISMGLDKIDADGNSRLHTILDGWHRERDDKWDAEFLASCLAGADLDAANDQQLVPLMMAIKAGSPASVCTLLHLGASYRVANAQGYGPLLLCAELGQKGCFKLLIDKMHADDTLKHRAARQGDGYTVLHFACVNGDSELLTLALSAEEFSRPAVINARLISARQQGNVSTGDNTSGTATMEGQTALHKTVVYDKAACATLLLKAGANPSVGDAKGCTPLHLAVLRENVPLVALLLKYGANVAARDAYDKTPLQCIARRRVSAARVMLLQAEAEASGAPPPPSWYGTLFGADEVEAPPSEASRAKADAKPRVTSAPPLRRQHSARARRHSDVDAAAIRARTAPL